MPPRPPRNCRPNDKDAETLMRDIGAHDSVDYVSLDLRGRHWVAYVATDHVHKSDQFGDPRDALVQAAARQKLYISATV